MDDEIKEILKELLAQIGATSARIIVDNSRSLGQTASLASDNGVDNSRSLGQTASLASDNGGDDSRSLGQTASLVSDNGGDDSPSRIGVPARTLALGGGEFLRVELPTLSTKPDGGSTDIEAAFERATRQLRALRRRWEVARLPEVSVTREGLGTEPIAGRVVESIAKYMQALATSDRATNAFVTKGTQLVASARPPDEQETARWQFLARRALATHAPHSSHGEVVDPDAYAMSFWYDASLVVLLVEPYAIDFIRHRCRQVARELCNLLPLLDPDPEAPAAIGPRPRRPTQP